MNYSVIAIGGVLNSVANSVRGITNVNLPLLGSYDGMLGGFLQGAISNVLYQTVGSLFALDVVMAEAYAAEEGYTTIAREAAIYNAPITLGGAGALSQVLTTRVFADNQNGTLMDAVQGAIVHPASTYISAMYNLK